MIIELELTTLALLALGVFPLLGFIWAPKTWVPGELVSAASMNTNVRDHLNEGLRAQTTTLTGDQDDFAIDGPFAYLKCNNASALSLTGAALDSAQIDGARIIVEAVNAAVTLKHEDSGSSAANRFTCDTGADIALAVTERALMFYDGANSRWRVGKISAGALSQAVGAVNLFMDPNFLIWPAGDTSAPAGTTLTSDGNSGIERNTTIPYLGGMSPELKLGTTATVSTKLTRQILASLPTIFRGSYVSVGAAVRTDVASLAQLEIDDGGTGGVTKSVFHPGDDAWSWIAFSHLFTNDATKFDVSMVADIGAQDASEVTALFDALTVIFGPSPPTAFIPAPLGEGTLRYRIGGEAATGTNQFRFRPGRPLLVRNVTFDAENGPTGAALILDVNHWDGSAWQSMYTTKPQIDAGDTSGGGEPGGTYRYRCFDQSKNDESDTDAKLNIDVDQVGSTVAGSGIDILVHILQYQDPLAHLKSY